MGNLIRFHRSLPPSVDPQQSLKQIAEALQLPAAAFCQEGAVSIAEAEVGEMLTLWMSIKSEPVRAKILATVQAIAAAQSD